MKKIVVPVVFVFLVIVLSVAFSACNDTSSGVNGSQAQQQQQNNSANDRLHKQNPYPVLNNSQELHNQVLWYERLADPNKIAYIYLMNTDGSVAFEYQIRAKCSSTNSQYSAPSTIVDGNAIVSNGASSTYNPQVVPAAQPDGSYGQNEQAVFCFLNDAHQSMIEFSETWHYVWSEIPLNVHETPQTIVVIPNGK